MKKRLLVRRYRKPEMVGRIIMPDTYREDVTQTLWEVVGISPDAFEAAGGGIEEGDIIKTRRRWPVDINRCDAQGNDLYIIGLESAGIMSVIRNTWDTEEESHEGVGGSEESHRGLSQDRH